MGPKENGYLVQYICTPAPPQNQETSLLCPRSTIPTSHSPLLSSLSLQVLFFFFKLNSRSDTTLLEEKAQNVSSQTVPPRTTPPPRRGHNKSSSGIPKYHNNIGIQRRIHNRMLATCLPFYDLFHARNIRHGCDISRRSRQSFLPIHSPAF